MPPMKVKRRTKKMFSGSTLVFLLKEDGREFAEDAHEQYAVATIDRIGVQREPHTPAKSPNQVLGAQGYITVGIVAHCER